MRFVGACLVLALLSRAQESAPSTREPLVCHPHALTTS